MELSEQATWVGEGIPNGAIIHCLMTPRPESSLCEQIETTSLPSTLPQLGSRPGLEERKEAQQRNILCKQTSSLQHVFVEASNADWVLELKRAEQERTTTLTRTTQTGFAILTRTVSLNLSLCVILTRTVSPNLSLCVIRSPSTKPKHKASP